MYFFKKGGYPIVLSDTAGVRESSDAVEQIGVARAVEQFTRADVRVHVTDNDDDALALLRSATQGDIVVRNKIDSASCSVTKSMVSNSMAHFVQLSCTTGDGVEQLLQCLTQVVTGL